MTIKECGGGCGLCVNILNTSPGSMLVIAKLRFYNGTLRLKNDFGFTMTRQMLFNHEDFFGSFPPLQLSLGPQVFFLQAHSVTVWMDCTTLRNNDALFQQFISG